MLQKSDKQSNVLVNLFKKASGAFAKQLSAFFMLQARLLAFKKFGRRFTPQDKNFALSLFFCSSRRMHSVSGFWFCHPNAHSKFGCLCSVSNLDFVILFWLCLGKRCKVCKTEIRLVCCCLMRCH